MPSRSRAEARCFPEPQLICGDVAEEVSRGRSKLHHIKALDDQILRSEVDHSAFSVQSFEDQLRLSAARIEAIKNQAVKFEINIHFLEPCAFEGIASEALAWKKFLNTQAEPSS